MINRRVSKMSYEHWDPDAHLSMPEAEALPRELPSIRQLPRETISLIAAGEVIERPASAIKELVENAIDAQARAIRIEIIGGGLALIRVTDDGTGIPPDQLEIAIRRHTTSKLRGHDLSSIRTLGFRGEGLASIAAVSDLTLTSAISGNTAGAKLVMSGGIRESLEPAAHTQGTTVTVRRLFQNYPARRASMRRPQDEAARILQAVRRLALTATHIRFEVRIEGRITLRTTGSGSLLTAIAEIYGSQVASSATELRPFRHDGCEVSGVICGAEMSRPTRNDLHLIINDRWTQCPGVLWKVETAYRPLLPRGRHPILILRVVAPLDRVDVNVHPAKLEVRLLDEAALGEISAEAIKEALATRPVHVDSSFFSSLPDFGLAEDRGSWDPEQEERELIVTRYLPPLRLVGQVEAGIVMLEGESGIYFVDQHRAHERVIYEQLKQGYQDALIKTTIVPEPVLVEMRPPQLNALSRHMDQLARLGFRFESFGERAFLLREVPQSVASSDAENGTASLLSEATTQDLVEELLSEVGAEDGWLDRLLIRIACRSAIRRNRKLSSPDMRRLVQNLGEVTSPAVCPHGSPLLVRIGPDVLDKQFGWSRHQSY